MNLEKEGESICTKILEEVFSVTFDRDWFTITGSSKPLWVCVGKAPGVRFPLLDDFEIFISIRIDEERATIDEYKLPGFDAEDKEKLQKIIDGIERP